MSVGVAGCRVKEGFYLAVGTHVSCEVGEDAGYEELWKIEAVEAGLDFGNRVEGSIVESVGKGGGTGDAGEPGKDVISPDEGEDAA